MNTDFTTLNLHPLLAKTLADIGYTTPTAIQSAIIPAMLAGQDVIGQSETGSGKTAAFSLPILQNLNKDRRHVQSLVVAPTRELAIQVAEATTSYGRNPGVRVLAVYGGQPYGPQLSRLKKGVDVVVGTPGRLLDLIRKNALDLSHVSTVVLDEADEMLSMGFITDIEAILDETEPTRQTALFSATLPQRIRRLSDRYMRDPQSFTIASKQRTVATVEQRYYLVNQSDKLAALTRLLEVEPITSALIFARKRLDTSELVNELAGRGFSAEALNGDMSQDARVQVLNRFRDNKIKILVATDVAARGLDIDDISHVFNYDLPQNPEVYVHRIGRTGRAGKTGIAITLLPPGERWSMRRIETYVKLKITRATLPTVEDIELHRKSRLVDQVLVWLRRGRCRSEHEIVTELADQGHDLTEIAVAALKMARVEKKQRPITAVKPVRESNSPKTRYSAKDRNPRNGRERVNGHGEKGMVRLALSTGKANGIRINQIVGSLSRFADIPGASLGKINIQKQHTFVDVPVKLVSRVLANTESYRIGRQTVTVKRA